MHVLHMATWKKIVPGIGPGADRLIKASAKDDKSDPTRDRPQQRQTAQPSRVTSSGSRQF